MFTAGSTSVQSLDAALEDIETTRTAMAAAVEADDWNAASACNASLSSNFDRIGGLLRQSAVNLSREFLDIMVARLADVVEEHEHLTARLCEQRNGVAAELGAAQQGRRVASHYLDTAGG